MQQIIALTASPTFWHLLTLEYKAQIVSYLTQVSTCRNERFEYTTLYQLWSLARKMFNSEITNNMTKCAENILVLALSNHPSKPLYFSITRNQYASYKFKYSIFN